MDLKKIIKGVSSELRDIVAATMMVVVAKYKVNKERINEILDKTDEISREIINKIEELNLDTPEESAFAVLSIANVLVDTVEIYLAENGISIDIDKEEVSGVTHSPEGMYI